MNGRQQTILSAVIKEYVETAVPVSSSVLVKKYKYDLSPATIRSEMLGLEKEGYLWQPHTSAGRIPTDKGYRYFVDKLMKSKSLSKKDQRALQTELLKTKAQYNRLVRSTAKILAGMTNSLAISSLDQENVFESGMPKLLKQPEFKEADRLCQIVDTLDYLDENVDKISKEASERVVDVYIGKESPIARMEDCSMIVSGFKTPKGGRGLLAVIGPKRMKYDHNMALVDYITKLLNIGGVVLIITYGLSL